MQHPFIFREEHQPGWFRPSHLHYLLILTGRDLAQVKWPLNHVPTKTSSFNGLALMGGQGPFNFWRVLKEIVTDWDYKLSHTSHISLFVRVITMQLPESFTLSFKIIASTLLFLPFFTSFSFLEFHMHQEPTLLKLHIIIIHSQTQHGELYH